MCGICGFTRAYDSEQDAATLKAMCDVMAHRGPDGEGRYIADGIALGHRRLALIDLEGGGQPIIRATSECAAKTWTTAVAFEHARGEAAPVSTGITRDACQRGRWSIVFNGEIYNYRELRAELQGLGYEFVTDSDTEVLLVGYIAWSDTVLQRLRGMFAFAIYDADTHELFCARDFFGIKPLYYTVQDGQFIFASEIKSVLEHPAYTRELNEHALAQYLCFQFSALHETFFKGIYKLPQGHCLRVSAGGSSRSSLLAAAVCLRRRRRREEMLLRPSMRLCANRCATTMWPTSRWVLSCRAASIRAIWLRAWQENPDIQTFTVGFAEYEGERDEVSWAYELAQQLHVSNDSKHIAEGEFWDAVPTVQWHMDEPSADPSAVALYFVDQLAARHVKAVLSGEGADEFFGGYRVYQAPLAANHANVVPKPLLRAGSKVLRATGMRGANYLERASERVEDWYYTNANGVAFSPDERDRILAVNVRSRLARMEHPEDTRDLIGLDATSRDGGHATAHITGIPAPQQLTAPVYNEVAARDEVSRMQYVDLWFWLVGDILLKTDKMSMAHSLESRVPFLDREVFALSATIPTSQKATERQTKVALREAAERAIPRDWAQKEKLGFPVPVVSWLREERYNQVKDAFTSNAAKRYFDTHELVRLLDEHRDGRRQLAPHLDRLFVLGLVPALLTS